MSTTRNTSPLLEVKNVAVHFGGLVAISDMSFGLHDGELLSLIGPNGAGKTTAFNVVTGFLRPTKGSLYFKGVSLAEHSPHEIAAMGLVRTFQRTSLFTNETVFDNILTGLHLQGKASFLETVLALPSFRREEQSLKDQVWDLLDFVGLSHRAKEQSGSLAYGEQRLLGVAIAMAAKAQVLLLDEPAAGMNAAETARFMEILQKIRQRNISILLVEHDMPLVMGVSDRVIVLNYGKIIANGTPAEVQNNPDVIEAYLGQGLNSMLELKNVVCRYGNVSALKDVSLTVEQGELVTIIGANGAGKSTTLKAISGLLNPVEGTIRFMGEDISKASAQQIISMGVSHCPEGRRVFPQMTVHENLEIGAYIRKDRSSVSDDIERMYEMFPRLRERSEQAAGTLSGGEQQMLAIARSLMSRPKLIMFDEPSLGLAPNIVEKTFEIIRQVRKAGTTVLMVEQNAFAALDMCDRGYLYESGHMTLQGTGQEMINDPHVRHAYLGG